MPLNKLTSLDWKLDEKQKFIQLQRFKKCHVVAYDISPELLIWFVNLQSFLKGSDSTQRHSAARQFISLFSAGRRRLSKRTRQERDADIKIFSVSPSHPLAQFLFLALIFMHTDVHRVKHSLRRRPFKMSLISPPPSTFRQMRRMKFIQQHKTVLIVKIFISVNVWCRCDEVTKGLCPR